MWNYELLGQWVNCDFKGECVSEEYPIFYYRHTTHMCLIGRFFHPKHGADGPHKQDLAVDISAMNFRNGKYISLATKMHPETGKRMEPILFHCRDINYKEVRHALCPQYVQARGETPLAGAGGPE